MDAAPTPNVFCASRPLGRYDICGASPCRWDGPSSVTVARCPSPIRRRTAGSTVPRPCAADCVAATRGRTVPVAVGRSCAPCLGVRGTAYNGYCWLAHHSRDRGASSVGFQFAAPITLQRPWLARWRPWWSAHVGDSALGCQRVTDWTESLSSEVISLVRHDATLADVQGHLIDDDVQSTTSTRF